MLSECVTFLAAADDDEAYSPGSSSNESMAAPRAAAPPTAPADALRTKMEELNRQIEEQKQQIMKMAQVDPAARAGVRLVIKLIVEHWRSYISASLGLQWFSFPSWIEVWLDLLQNKITMVKFLMVELVSCVTLNYCCSYQQEQDRLYVFFN